MPLKRFAERAGRNMFLSRTLSNASCSIFTGNLASLVLDRGDCCQSPTNFKKPMAVIGEEEVVRKRALSASTPFATNCCNLQMSTLVSHLMTLLTALVKSLPCVLGCSSAVRLWLQQDSCKQATLEGMQALVHLKIHLFLARVEQSCNCYMT